VAERPVLPRSVLSELAWKPARTSSENAGHNRFLYKPPSEVGWYS